ncbi:uncharacterized protein LOC132712788 [Ruditapes philippinarum]|uniref:uncharacterized protein LOC132712788 n=1 Tax=Ruditapes philippinarum TaxID=129788 RepID=UPI00295B7988|nr:uncharacterized protein LOC132712788 [Ruditapes philippinarum]
MNKKREESKTKRRRLESEVSQSSGITNLSNVTQTTELSSNFTDNYSDSSSVNQFVQTKRAKRQPARKHQVSWSIDDDDTFEKERVKGDTPAQQLNPRQYDNNFAGTNNSHRATESRLDTFALSYNKQPFDEACDRNNCIFQSKLRRNKTSQIHGHENDIQRQILLDELIRRNDAQQLQSKRSQSATSLRVNSVQNLYESLQSQNAAQNMLNNNPPVQTVVHITSNDSNYLHPVNETQILQSRRSQSATSLRVTSVQNLYESLNSQNAAQKVLNNNHPVQTVVHMTSNDSNYLHPVTETQILQSRRSQSATYLRVYSVQNLYESLQSQNAAQNMLNNNPPVKTVVHMTSNDSNYLHPVTETQILQSRRSQSATSLRVNSVQNLYESLQPQKAAQNMLNNNPPVQTVVHMTSNDSNYLHPVTETQILQSRRSQSATYLRVNSVQNRSDSHLYESLNSQNAAQNMLNNNPPVQTVVHMTSNDSNYLHPVTETQIHRNNLRKAKNMSANSGDKYNAYADVMRDNEPFNISQGQKKCFDFCKNSFYRNGFYILLIFNVILILLNTFGLPYVYFAINQEKEVSKAANLNEGGEFASAVHSEFCVKCNNLNEVVNSSEVSIKDGQCCIKSAEKLLPILLEIVDDIAGVPPPEKKANVPVIQLRAATTRNKNHTKIIWQKMPGVGKIRSNVTDDEINVPKTGYYYVYSRVHYKLPAYKDESEEFTIVHTIYKTKKDDTESPLDEVVQRCFPTNTTGDVRHANQLGSIHHLKKGDRLFIKLRYPQYLLPENTLFGWFMVAT